MSMRVINIAAACVLVPVVLIGAATAGLGQIPAPTTSIAPSATDIPLAFAAFYQQAATKLAIPVAVLSAIGRVECDHGQNPACATPNSAGAQGPMQFLPATFAAYANASGSPLPSPYDPRDAIFAAAAKLAADGVNTDPWTAIFSYNHDNAYVATVLGWSVAYGYLPDATTLCRAVLAHPNLTLGPLAADDVRSGRIDTRVLAVLLTIVTTHRLDDVGPFITGHSDYVAGTDRLSNHAGGRAVDIGMVDGIAVSATNSAAKAVATSVLLLAAPLRPDEIGAPWQFAALGPRSFTEGHGDHLHFGFDSSNPSS